MALRLAFGARWEGLGSSLTSPTSLCVSVGLYVPPRSRPTKFFKDPEFQPVSPPGPTHLFHNSSVFLLLGGILPKFLTNCKMRTILWVRKELYPYRKPVVFRSSKSFCQLGYEDHEGRSW